jgi:8-oxo-dGTP pyrophosphatase MutT (NUDIX family)
MAIPDFLRRLREKVGHELLLLPGVCALVFDEHGQILLNRRSDSGRWAVLGGIPEPGEELADALVREVREETGVQVLPQRITGVYTSSVICYPNGDQVQYIITAFRCQVVEGQPRVNDDESLEVRYFPVGALPELRPDHRRRIEHALRDGEPFFQPPKVA